MNTHRAPAILGVVFLTAVLASSRALAQDCGAGVIFADGFESGDTSAWGVEPRPPYGHVMPADVGETLGVGVIAPVPTEPYTGSSTIDTSTTIENVVADNYMHTLVGGPEAHADGFQIGEASPATGEMYIGGNYIDPDNREIGRTDVVFGTNFSQVELLIEDNYFEPWGHYTMRCSGEATRCVIRDNVYGPGFESVEQHLLLANAGAPPAPSEFCCNRYASGGLVEEFFEGHDLVLGAEHWTVGCPSMP